MKEPARVMVTDEEHPMFNTLVEIEGLKYVAMQEDGAVKYRLHLCCRSMFGSEVVLPMDLYDEGKVHIVPRIACEVVLKEQIQNLYAAMREKGIDIQDNGVIRE